jgi:hypothetical protein
MIKKKTLLLTSILALTFSATAFQANLHTEKEVASPESSAQFQLEIENQEAVNRTYSLSLLSPKSSWFYYPSTVKVLAGSNQTVNITVSPVEESIKKQYSFNLKVREQETGETEEMTGRFRVKQPYTLHITDTSLNRNEFMPGEVVETSIRVKNLDNSPVENYRVETRFENETRTDTGTSILPGGERLYENSFRVPKNATPGERTLTHAVYLNDEIEQTAERTITVAQVENISTETETDNRILTVSKSREVVNTGNSPANASVTLSVPSYLSSITSPEPEADSTETADGDTVYRWKTELAPDESFSATYTTKYWIPLLGVILLTAGIIAIKRIGNTLTVTKKVESNGQEVKIKIDIVNSSEKTFEQLELEEFIPDIATVDESFEMNTPKIRKTNEGTKINWKLEEVRPGDQRIIQYKIKPKVQVDEEAELKPAIIKDENGQKIAESNSASARFTPDTT